jgi:VCBS repeat-containing protein
VASVTVVTAPTEGQLTFAADGSFSFNASTGFDWLAAGQTHDVTFVYRVTDANGDHADATATVTITGTNDAPVVTGDVAGAVVEDVTLTASGKLTATDVDLTDTVAFAGSAVGAYGSLAIDATGAWSYALANSGFAVQHLAAGQVANDVFTVSATDSAGAVVTKDIAVTITGTNDTPVVTGDVAAAVVEDVTLTANGKLTASDVDLTDTVAFAGSAVGAHGSLTIDATGAWSYALANSGFSVQHLAAGQVANDVFTVTATDSAGAVVTKDITVSITGTNDAPTIAGSYTGMVGNSGTMLTAAGKLVAADIDGDALTLTSTGTAHYGTFAVDAAGAWSYHLDPTLASYQALATGTTVTETFAVQADDGHGGLTTHAVDVNVVGLAAGLGSMTIDMTLLRDFAGFQMIPTVLGTTILTDARHSPIAITGPVSDFNIIFSTDFSTAGDFNTALTPNAHLHVIAGSPVNGANVVALTAAHLVTDLYTGLGNDLVSIWGNTAFGSSVDAGGGIDTLEINNTLSGAGQSIDASAMFTNGAIAINGNADAWHVTGFENFKFTGWNQTVIATDHNDVMTDRGQNTIYGGGGNDSIINARLGTGAHSELYGGDGNDLFLSQGAALSRDGDIVDGGAGTDGLTLWNIESFDASASSTFDVLTQTGTLHVISVENLTMYGLATDNTMIGGAGNDVISGNFGNDILSGGAGNDVVDGGYSNDTLSGDSGTNIVYGGVGDDWLNSFLGTDLLNGGVGNDTFNLAPAATDAFQTTIFIQGYGVNDGADTVNGFNADSGIGHDVISLNQIHDATGLLVASVAQVLADSTQTADGVLIDFGAGSSLMLNGLTLAQLSVDDFTFA